MKFITFAVPCFNSADYMKKCINSLLVAGDDAEIIIIDDGSVDSTAEIADAYAEKYPTIVRVHHQENAGHGSGVNYGIKNATGLYFKVVDSDDRLDAASVKRLLFMMKRLHSLRCDVDAFICNYVYEHTEDNTRYAMNYRNVFPQNCVFGWNRVKPFHISQYLMMHSLIFRTKVLHDAGTELPLHTYYVDNIYICATLPYVRKMCYIDTDLYRYYIGRSDQSVNFNVFMSRIDQHLKITHIIIDSYDMKAARAVNSHLERYLTRHVAILCATASAYLTMRGDDEAMRMRREFWDYLKKTNPELYRDVRLTTFAGLTDLPGKFGAFLITKGYEASQKMFKYN